MTALARALGLLMLGAITLATTAVLELLTGHDLPPELEPADELSADPWAQVRRACGPDYERYCDALPRYYLTSEGA